MNRIEAAFARQRDDGSRSVIPFVVGGHPSLEATIALLPELARAGAAIMEIGIPFSDPIADGPVISEAMRSALDHGTTPAKLFEAIASVRSTVDAAIVFMVSVSIVERMGRGPFIEAARKAGADGLVIPDLDLDEAPAVAEICRSSGISLSMLVAPATGADRMRRIVACSSGFIYLLARQGVTGSDSARAVDREGERREQPAAADLGRRVRELRSISDLPIACGFGISTASQVATVTAHADAAIVGSALVRAMDEPLSVITSAANAKASAAPAATASIAAAVALMREVSRGLPSTT